MTDEIPMPGAVLGTAAAYELLDEIDDAAKGRLTQVETSFPGPPLLGTKVELAAFQAGIRAGALATWAVLYRHSLLKLDQERQ